MRWYTNVPLVDDMLLVMSHLKLRQEANSTILDHQPQKARSANCRRCGIGISGECTNDLKCYRVANILKNSPVYEIENI